MDDLRRSASKTERGFYMHVFSENLYHSRCSIVTTTHAAGIRMTNSLLSLFSGAELVAS